MLCAVDGLIRTLSLFINAPIRANLSSVAHALKGKFCVRTYTNTMTASAHVCTGICECVGHYVACVHFCRRRRLTFSIADRVAMPEIYTDEIHVNAASSLWELCRNLAVLFAIRSVFYDWLYRKYMIISCYYNWLHKLFQAHFCGLFDLRKNKCK